MNSAAGDDIWRKCSICKTGIGFGGDYYQCSVSTCNRKRTGLFFCGLPCFEAHLPEARHRDAWAEAVRAPSREEWRVAQNVEAATAGGEGSSTSSAPRGTAERRVVVPSARGTAEGGAPERVASVDALEHEVERDVLVVVSKLKKYVRDSSGMNTSDAVLPVLSDHLRELCRSAIRHAGQDGRRTVLDRDFVKAIASESRSPRGGQI